MWTPLCYGQFTSSFGRRRTTRIDINYIYLYNMNISIIQTLSSATLASILKRFHCSCAHTSFCGRYSCLTVSVGLWVVQPGFKHWPRSLCSVVFLGRTQITVPLSTIQRAGGRGRDNAPRFFILQTLEQALAAWSECNLSFVTSILIVFSMSFIDWI